MLTIRFQRTGKANRAEFRVVVAPKTAAAQKKFTEILGNYNPRTKELVIKNQDRLQHWLSQNIDTSPSVHNLLIAKNLLTGTKKKSFSVPKKPAVAPEAATPAASAPDAGTSTPEAVVEPVTEAPVAEVANESVAETAK